MTIYGKMNSIIVNAQNTMFIEWSCQNATKATVAITDNLFVLPPRGI